MLSEHAASSGARHWVFRGAVGRWGSSKMLKFERAKVAGSGRSFKV